MAARGIVSAPLPPAPSGYQTHRYQVGVDGRLLGLFYDGSRGLIAAAVGAGWRPIAHFPFSDYCVFDVAPDDCCVVARTGNDGGDNALVLKDGIQVGTFDAGDGLNHLQCDARGGIWTGYYDVGVFGKTIGRHGIVRFERDGAVASYYAGQIVDCYALNVAREHTWSCWDTSFPVVRLDDNCAEERWTNGLIDGVDAIAVSEPYVVLAGGYPPHRNRIALVELHLDHVRLVGEFDALSAIGANLEGAWFVARNDRLYVVDDTTFLSIPVSHFASQQT
jgi:hypothetical protein